MGGEAQRGGRQRRGLGGVLLVPVATTAAVFAGALGYFSLAGADDGDGALQAPPAPPAAAPPARPEDLPAASGPGRLLVTRVAEVPETARLHLVSLDGRHQRPVTGPPRGGGPTYDFSAAWSPDGRWIAFARSAPRDGRGLTHLYVAAADGSEPRRLTTGPIPELLPAWSPDSRTIVFMRRTGSDGSLWVVRPDGSGLRKLLDRPGTYEDFAAFSPDGSTIAFTVATEADEDLYLMNADGTEQRALLDGPQKDSAPAWSPDGTRIAFVRDAHVYVMGADGSDLRPLTRGPVEDAVPRWSPDGERIAFTRHPGHVLVIRADGTGLSRVPLDGVVHGAEWEPEP